MPRERRCYPKLGAQQLGDFRIFSRSFNRLTNFNPDQTSVTAHTFTSTKPAASPIARIMFSSRSVVTAEVFLGQLTHNIPAGASCSENRAKSFVNARFDFVNTIAKSIGPCLGTSHFASSAWRSARTSAGASMRRTRNPSLIPQFFRKWSA